MKEMLDFRIEESAISDGAIKLLQVVRPQWNPSNIKFKTLTDGITNKLIRCSIPYIPEEQFVLIRIYGANTDLLIDRQQEIRTIKLLNKEGLAPQLYNTFENGLVYEYVPGKTLTPESVKHPEIYPLVARHMAKLHKVQLAPEEYSITFDEVPIWKRIRRFWDLIPETYSNSQRNAQYGKLQLSKEKLMSFIEKTKLYLQLDFGPLVLCHNDLLLGNVVHNEEQKSVQFIDFEYASLNFQAFDIANHFAEFAGVENVDYSNCPDKEFQMKWLTEYLQEYNKDNQEPVALQQLLERVNNFTAASHLMWGLWALVQAEISDLDFDFINYAAIRIKEFSSIMDAIR